MSFRLSGFQVLNQCFAYGRGAKKSEKCFRHHFGILSELALVSSPLKLDIHFILFLRIFQIGYHRRIHINSDALQMFGLKCCCHKSKQTAICRHLKINSKVVQNLNFSQEWCFVVEIGKIYRFVVMDFYY